MNRGCKHNIGDVIKGLKIISEPYKIDGDRNYRAIVQCQFCDSEPFDVVLSDLKRYVFDGCGCQNNRSNSINWKSFDTWCKENNSNLLDLWDYDLNDKTPDIVSSCTNDEYYFKCPCGVHKSEKHRILTITRLTERIKPICRACNSIAQHLIDKYGNNALSIYWDYEKNTEDPWQLAFGTHIEVWIKCPNNKHDSYCRRIKDLITRDVGCPECAIEAETSSYQTKTYNYIQNTYGYEIKRERECSIIAINPITNYQLPYDNDVIIKDDHLIVEVHGEQHYNKNSGFIKLSAKAHNISIDEEFKRQQFRDEYKKQYALKNGYFYIVIPYWTFKDESYKTMIDTKIYEILSLNNINLLPPVKEEIINAEI